MEVLISFPFMLAQVYLWYPITLVTGGTTAKIMIAAKDNFLGKYIYRDTIARNIAAVIYRVSGAFRDLINIDTLLVYTMMFLALTIVLQIFYVSKVRLLLSHVAKVLVK